jgi:hypothetical protein
MASLSVSGGSDAANVQGANTADSSAEFDAALDKAIMDGLISNMTSGVGVYDMRGECEKIRTKSDQARKRDRAA